MDAMKSKLRFKIKRLHNPDQPKTQHQHKRTVEEIKHTEPRHEALQIISSDSGPSLNSLLDCYPILEQVARHLITDDVVSLSLVNRRARCTMAPSGNLSNSVLKASMKCRGAEVVDITADGNYKSIRVGCQISTPDSKYCHQCGDVVCRNCRFGSLCWLRGQMMRSSNFIEPLNSKHTLISKCSQYSYSVARYHILKARAKTHCKRHSSASKRALKSEDDCKCQIDFPWASNWLCTSCVNVEFLKLSESYDLLRTPSNKVRCSHVDLTTGERCEKFAREFSVKQCQLCSGLVGPLHPKTLFASCCLQFVGICGLAASVYWAMCLASALPKCSDKFLKFLEVKILRSDGVVERKLLKFGDWLEERVDNLDLKMDSIGLD
ncbi:hypothetical protein K431DRAFT_297521 [Polychaeton citri CBS 116435]|uniref:Uncharacterized protein n=1 Tax=Polychaeton citri CBS 116435 TaxID=1314669 RepID=A0A9P4Q1F8_9PEZI|nr:hypothetical protein K431DRAFT_297521 [Polychaeton citri CBS 116435]